MKKTQLIIFLSIVYAILLVVHVTIYEAIRLVFPQVSPRILLGLAAVLPLLFIGSNALAFWVNNFVSRNAYRLLALWIGLTNYLFFAAIALSVVSFLPGVNFAIAGKIFFLAAILVTGYGVVHSQQIKIVPVTVKLANLPAAWVNQKIVFVSDLHLGQIRGENFAARITGRINHLNPAVVFIGGDLYDGVKVNNRKIIEPLKNLQARLGVYFITGNHDGFTNQATTEDVASIANAGIKVLRDEQIEINGVNFIGVDYKSTVGRENFAKVLQLINLNPNQPNILIKHVPDYIDVAQNAGIDLQLSGHTHRAQVWPLRFLPRLIYKGFDYGLKPAGPMQVYTSSGVGTWGPPLRVGTNSEIVLITFEKG